MRKIVGILLTLLLSACGGGSGGGNVSPEADQLKTGIFIDSVVSGLMYSSASQSGITNNDGEFAYSDGETITFYIGDIVLGSALGREVITPLELSETNGVVNANKLINILRLLQTLDEDQELESGIQITSHIRQAASNYSIEIDQPVDQFFTDDNLTMFLAEVTDQPLVNINDALQHFKQSISNNQNLTSLLDVQFVTEIEPNNSFDLSQNISGVPKIVGELSRISDSKDHFEFSPSRKM